MVAAAIQGFQKESSESQIFALFFNLFAAIIYFTISLKIKKELKFYE